jgi:transposase
MAAKSRTIPAKSRTIPAKRLAEAVNALWAVCTALTRLSVVLPCLKGLAEKVAGVVSMLAGLGAVKDSSNNGKPPGGDIGKRKRQVREKAGRPPGGQKGHKGATRELENEVTETVDVSGGAADEYANSPLFREVEPIRRQLINVRCLAQVTEYVSRVFVNVETGRKVSFEFPKGVDAPVQFGGSVKALAVYGRDHQHASYERMQEMFRDVYGVNISLATLVAVVREAGQSRVIDDFEAVAARALANSPCNGADETSVGVNGRKSWVHELTNALFSLFTLHASRGKEGADAPGIL